MEGRTCMTCGCSALITRHEDAPGRYRYECFCNRGHAKITNADTRVCGDWAERRTSRARICETCRWAVRTPLAVRTFCFHPDRKIPGGLPMRFYDSCGHWEGW